MVVYKVRLKLLKYNGFWLLSGFLINGFRCGFFNTMDSMSGLGKEARS